MATEPPALRLPRPAGAWALALAAMAVVVWVRLIPHSLAGVDASERELLFFRAEDGREYPYAPGYDSYAWLRQARNRLQSGSPCDAVHQGVCWDTSTLAPLGAPMPYEHSLHVAAIALAQRVATVLRPAFPLEESAFLVTLIVGALGVPPAFAIGRRLAGNLGGFAAALLVGLNPVFLVRSGSLDNDAWNVVLPLYAAWAAIAAMGERALRRQAAFAAAAGCAFALHALVWRGWVFTFAVVLAALAANAVAAALQSIARSRAGWWRDRDLGRAARALVCFAALLIAGALALGSSAGTDRVVRLVRSLIGEAGTAMRPVDAAETWPDTLGTVGELARPDLGRIARMTGGTAYFFVGWLGMVLLLLPRRDWRGWHFALLVGANYAYRYLLVHGPPGRVWLIVLLALPLIVALIAGAVAEAVGAGASSEARAADPGAILVVTWFLAALFLSFDGVRFVMLLAPPFGLACGVAIGRLYEWACQFLERLPANRAVLRAAAFCLLCLALIPFVRVADRAVGVERPKVSDAWAEALAKIRAETPGDAIVHTWWPYGYFVSFLAERRVSVDGGMLPTHVPHWVGRAFLTDDEEEAAGLFRMLECGSDATPTTGNERGAYQRILRWREDAAETHALLIDLARLERPAAEMKLDALGAGPARREEILAATHCAPPASYLVLSDELTATTGWVRLGAWSPQDGAVSPPLDFWTRRWVACRGDGGGPSLRCTLQLGWKKGEIVLDGFTYRRDDPSRGVLRWHRRGETAERDGAPAEIVVAGPGGFESTALANPLDENIGVLIDAAADRVLLASPRLLRSTLVHLVLLDGRYARRFERFDKRRGYAGEQVTVWRIKDSVADGRADGRTSPPPGPSAD